MLTKELKKQIVELLTKELGQNYIINPNLHVDEEDNAALKVSEVLGVTEDDVRYIDGLPR